MGRFLALSFICQSTAIRNRRFNIILFAPATPRYWASVALAPFRVRLSIGPFPLFIPHKSPGSETPLLLHHPHHIPLSFTVSKL
jgi:hypothetical protein